MAGLAGTAAITAASATERLVEDAIQARNRGEEDVAMSGDDICTRGLGS